MGRRYEASKILCPCYRGETANMIYCAAPYPECNFHIAFGNRAEKKEYRKNFCCTTGYGRCIIAKGVEQDKTRGEI